MNQLKRLQSGIEGLDELLKGGFVAGSSYIIQGRPGSGKTILANQIGFNHARAGGRVLFATLLAEPHERLFQFLSTLSFLFLNTYTPGSNWTTAPSVIVTSLQ